MQDWAQSSVTSEAVYLVVGALLAGLTGIAITSWHDQQKVKSVRKALGHLLYHELIDMSPRDDPIYHDPPSAPHLRLGALPQLLAPGIIDPRKERDLLRHLIHLTSVVENYNAAAQAYNAAAIGGASDRERQAYYNDLQGANWDYAEAHKWTMYMIQRLDPSITLDEGVKLT